MSEAVGKKLNDLGETVEKATQVEVAVFRDLMMQAFPGLVQLSEVGALKISAAPTPTPTPSVGTTLWPRGPLRR